MKLAVSGKGGVGKSTLSAFLAYFLQRKGKKVLAVDADPDADLALALGIPTSEHENILTIAKQKSLIEERTGSRSDEYGGVFKLNPDVSDVADKYAFQHKGIDLLVMGAIEKGGAGCACAENTFLKSLVQNLILHRDEVVILDMEAGVEHLGRSTTSGVDALLVVVDAGQRSLKTYKRISDLAEDIGIKKVIPVANKVREGEEESIRKSLGDPNNLTIIPYFEEFYKFDQAGGSNNPQFYQAIDKDLEALLALI